MESNIFEFIETTGSLLEKKYESLHKIEQELDKFFSATFFSKDHFIDVKTRVKAKDSLKEKILRNNLYLQYDTPENLLINLSDIIGVRIECRFIDDERKIYKEIYNLFRVKSENGYYQSFINNNIFLNMDEKQPTKQKNGFEIYKIDGKYINENHSYCFELQIKSLVNVFWGDIDHKILYKNFNYNLTEKFIVDVMGSIKETLEMIDRELMLMYNQMNEHNSNTSEDNVKNSVKVLLSKSLHDIYYKKLRLDLGFTVDFRSSCDAIVDYIFVNVYNVDENYMSEFLRLIERMKFLELKTINFGSELNFGKGIQFNDHFTKKIGKKIIDIVPRDFNWKLFLQILFDVEEGDPNTIFLSLLNYIKNKYNEVILVALANQEISEKLRGEIVDFIMNYIADSFEKDACISIITENSINAFYDSIIKSMGEVVDLWDFNEIKKTLTQNLNLYI